MKILLMYESMIRNSSIFFTNCYYSILSMCLEEYFVVRQKKKKKSNLRQSFAALSALLCLFSIILLFVFLRYLILCCNVLLVKVCKKKIENKVISRSLSFN